MCSCVNIKCSHHTPRLQVRSLLADRHAWQEWQQRLGPAPAASFALLPGVPSFAQLPSADSAPQPAGAAPAQRDAGEMSNGSSSGEAGLAAADLASGGDDLDGLLRCATHANIFGPGLLGHIQPQSILRTWPAPGVNWTVCRMAHIQESHFEKAASA